MTPEIDHVLTCSITGLSAAATVTFKEADGTVITNPLATDYVVDNGFSSFSVDSQEATLELKPAKLRLLTSPATYICEANSLTGSIEYTATVTMLVFGKILLNIMLLLLCCINIKLSIRELEDGGVYHTQFLTLSTRLLMLIDKLMTFPTEFCFINIAKQ